MVLQNEKRHMLMESETMKLKERDEKHQTQLETWKAELGPRKKVRRVAKSFFLHMLDSYRKRGTL